MPETDRLVHLVRHGEVRNPHHVVYSDLPGYGLSERGHTQAETAATRLADRPVGSVVSSPLQRAVETAVPIAARHDVQVSVDVSLTEWLLGKRWAGHRWEDLPHVFPGELDAYLEDPVALTFGAEPILELAERIAQGVEAAWSATPHGDLVVVSHQDPIQAGRRRVTGSGFSSFNVDKPAHATVITLDPTSEPWFETEMWTPPQGG